MPTAPAPAPASFALPPPVPSRPRRGWSVPVAFAALVVVAVGASVAWAADDEGSVPDEVPVLVADGIRDDFARSDDEEPAELGDARTGQPWDEVSGAWEVVDGTAHVDEANEQGRRTLAVVDLASADGAMAVTLPTVIDGQGLVFRFQDAFNYWFVTAGPSVGTWRIDRLEAGSVVPLGNVGLAPVDDGTTIEVRFEGRDISVFVDGELRRELQDPALEQATGVGLIASGPDPRGATWDDVVAVPIVDPSSASVAPS